MKGLHPPDGNGTIIVLADVYATGKKWRWIVSKPCLPRWIAPSPLQSDFGKLFLAKALLFAAQSSSPLTQRQSAPTRLEQLVMRLV